VRPAAGRFEIPGGDIDRVAAMIAVDASNDHRLEAARTRGSSVARRSLLI
jgi:hypothetical protein